MNELCYICAQDIPKDATHFDELPTGERSHPGCTLTGRRPSDTMLGLHHKREAKRRCDALGRALRNKQQHKAEQWTAEVLRHLDRANELLVDAKYDGQLEYTIFEGFQVLAATKPEAEAIVGDLLTIDLGPRIYSWNLLPERTRGDDGSGSWDVYIELNVVAIDQDDARRAVELSPLDDWYKNQKAIFDYAPPYWMLKEAAGA